MCKSPYQIWTLYKIPCGMFDKRNLSLFLSLSLSLTRFHEEKFDAKNIF